MLQAGYVRRLAPGVFASLPLMQRVTSKLTAIVDEEMARAGCQRLTMPTLLPASLWQQSGRWHSAGRELWRVQDRRNAAFCLGPTHEEVFAAIVGDELAHSPTSLPKLPLRLYQITSKFRDEVRPRFGLMRSREFLMKDLYTFDNSPANAMRTYESVTEAYRRIFDRIGLRKRYAVAQADTGIVSCNCMCLFYLFICIIIYFR